MCISGRYTASEHKRIVAAFFYTCLGIGSFLSAWLGGLSAEVTGSYVLIWSAAALLSLFAMIVSFCIIEPNKYNDYNRNRYDLANKS
jgi:predicted MFS family arabinose efflux permease